MPEGLADLDNAARARRARQARRALKEAEKNLSAADLAKPAWMRGRLSCPSDLEDYLQVTNL